MKEVSTKTVSKAKMQAEWLEIQAAQVNPARFRPLYERYYESMFRFIFKRTADEFLAGDLCAQVFLKAIQKLKDYDFRGVPFSSWLFRIASNEIALYFRQANKQRVIGLEESQIKDMADEMEVSDTDALLEKMLMHLDELKPTDMELIEMRFFEGRSFKEIAEILDITENNAKVKTYRTLDRLKKKMVN